MGKTLDSMIKGLPGNKILGRNDFFHPLVDNKDENEKKAKDWAKEILKM